jgi:hypothetical protein
MKPIMWKHVENTYHFFIIVKKKLFRTIFCKYELLNVHFNLTIDFVALM